MAIKVAVIGLGTFGYELACALAREGAEVLALDVDPKLIQEIKDEVTSAAQLDALDKKALSALGIDEFDAAIVGFRSRLDTSILVTMLLKELGLERVIVLAASEEHRKALTMVGATQVVFPEMDLAQKLARRLVMPALIDEIVLSPQFGIIEIDVPSTFVGKNAGGFGHTAQSPRSRHRRKASLEKQGGG